VVGRHVPTEADPSPTLYRMKVWAPDEVKAKSKFWYFLRRLRRVKKANGQIVSVSEIHEAKPTTIKNFGIWVRYQSRTGYHNAYKEYREATLNAAVDALYAEMASRHRVRYSSLFIIKTATVPASSCRRANTIQFHDSKIRFPVTRRTARPSAPEYRTLYKASRPNVAMR
jgi:large subunit ribosomal protein L18Ae